MRKKQFIALADSIKAYNESAFDAGSNTVSPLRFGWTQLLALADFCQSQNPKFDRDWWLGYIQGKCGPSGGSVRK